MSSFLLYRSNEKLLHRINGKPTSYISIERRRDAFTVAAASPCSFGLAAAHGRGENQ